MPKDVSFMQYMRAHGNTPGPTQRPLLTGAVSGLLAHVPAGAVLYYSGALESIARGFATSVWAVLTIDAAVMVLAGMLYAAVFKRAANDCEGGWLFGAASGFLLWMCAPVTLWQLFAERPLATGRAAMGLFAAHVLYGLALGLLYPRVHALVQRRLNHAPEKDAGRPPAAPEKISGRAQQTNFAAQSAKIQGGSR